MRKKWIPGVAAIFLLGVVSWGEASAGKASDVIFQAFQEEMSRSLTDLKTEDFPAPYFINYQIRHNHHIEVSGSLGALVDSKDQEKRHLFVDVRVGNPKFDSSTPGSHDHNVRQLVPLDNDLKSLKRALWYETDIRYKQAVMNLLRKKGRRFSGVETFTLANFSAGNGPAVRIDVPLPEQVAIAQWEDTVRQVSGRFTRSPDIEKSSVRIVYDHNRRYYLDSEGNRIEDGKQHYKIVMETWIKSDAGSQIHDQDTVYFSSSENFPTVVELNERADRLMAETQALKHAPRMEPYVGPALFSPEAAAVLFHEAIGHRLEGDRLRLSHDGKTFVRKIGQQILPSFVSVIDNPRLQRSSGKDLLGHYLYDDQGQQSEEVVLVDKGVLKNFLLSRAPVAGFNKSNGHGRSDGVKFPFSRMGNVIVHSDKVKSQDQLKESLLQEVRRQGKPYGLMIRKMISGETLTDTKQFQVFKGKPLYLYKVYPEDGREELVRGVEFVGTPLAMISKIIATGDDTTVTNGFCVAESGAVPVSSQTPSILLSEVELQTAHEVPLRKPILNPPPL